MLIDSNILIYSINSSSPKHKKAQAFMQKHIGNLEIAHQNILETLRVLTHKKFPTPMKIDDALESIESILKGTQVISPSYRTHRIALELVKKHQLTSDQIFDAYLVATALDNGIYTIATDNTKDFVILTEIKVISPFDYK